MAEPTLIDTDILIDAGRSVAEAVRYLANIKTDSAPATSVVSQMELLVGCRNKSEVRALDKFLRKFQVVNIGELISEKAVGLLRQYRLSHGLLIADSLIAATALILDWPLATKNQKDFRFVKGLKLLAYP